MPEFNPRELTLLESIWRAAPDGHDWTGWAHVGAAPKNIWIFRTRANWRVFTLSKLESGGYRLCDDTGEYATELDGLEAVADAVSGIPALTQAV